MTYPVSVDSEGRAECGYCHEALPTVKRRRIPNSDEDGIYLCRECWADVQKDLRP